MLTPAAKRRRAEAATATLSRPFRSPSIRRGGAARIKSKDTKEKDSSKDTKITEPTPEEAVKDPDIASPERLHKRRKQPSRLREATKIEEKAPDVSLDNLLDQFCLDMEAGDKLIEVARSSAKELQEQQKGGASSAVQRNATKDDDDENKELRILIAKWKEAGRLAADEVFSIVSERVERVGGVKAWRAMAFPQQENEYGSKRRRRRSGRDRDEDDNDNDGAQDDDENDFEDEDEDEENRSGEDDVEESQVSLLSITSFQKHFD